MLTVQNCLRCGHSWASRRITRPDRCARCTRPNYWRPKRIPKQKPLEKRAPGKPLKYPINLLNIGQTLTVPGPEFREKPLSIRGSIVAWGKRHGRTFKLSRSLAGLHVRRVL